MLKSRALPEDFDTTQVLRTPFDNKTASETPVPFPFYHMTSISGANASKMLLTDGLQRLNDDDYVISPLSSASTTTGSGFPSTAADRNLEGYMPNGTLANRAAPTPVPDLQRHNLTLVCHTVGDQWIMESTGQALVWLLDMMAIDSWRVPSHQQDKQINPWHMVWTVIVWITFIPFVAVLETDFLPIGQQLHSYQHSLTMPASKGFGGLDLNSHMQPHGRHIPALQSLPVSEAPDYRHYSYSHHPYSMSTAMPYTQANASSMSLPASFPSDTGSASHGSVGGSTEDRINNPPQALDPLRTKFSNQPFEYSNYL
ncbi:unnamed protein product [Aspergillus oryzae]|uniref:Unnamed protein product n=2 Tax=Aspergillus oryzae TaxID=5062 RepID=A0AAN5BWV0_ASPOZ|nr:unnamed protein product [Aspergillus oryzae]GMF94106.1 unnamed protein product [Aspergillus oryzae]GMG10173.1 unnamed protein product [Aspergillus oryzae]GMG36831.1 unnamed protein product [Aspergillus oryzae]GMG51957.1 unnamed protein product [Aspergillus oryzae var. brunneus]